MMVKRRGTNTPSSYGCLCGAFSVEARPQIRTYPMLKKLIIVLVMYLFKEKEKEKREQNDTNLEAMKSDW